MKSTTETPAILKFPPKSSPVEDWFNEALKTSKLKFIPEITITFKSLDAVCADQDHFELED